MAYISHEQDLIVHLGYGQSMLGQSVYTLRFSFRNSSMLAALYRLWADANAVYRGRARLWMQARFQSHIRV